MKKKHLLNKYGTLMANELINMGTPMDIDDRFTTGSDGSLSENPYGYYPTSFVLSFKIGICLFI
jgi:hypothetical protein